MSCDLERYFTEICNYPTYTALGMIFKETLEQVAEKLWDGNNEDTMELVTSALEVAEKVEEYYNAKA